MCPRGYLLRMGLMHKGKVRNSFKKVLNDIHYVIGVTLRYVSQEGNYMYTVVNY
jgi:hypothetical protein